MMSTLFFMRPVHLAVEEVAFSWLLAYLKDTLSSMQGLTRGTNLLQCEGMGREFRVVE
jgi:hypothetical protein